LLPTPKKINHGHKKIPDHGSIAFCCQINMAILSSLNSIKTGLTIIVDGEPHIVLWADFMRTAQRKPVMRTKLRNLINGKVLEKSFKPGDKVEEADLANSTANYLYKDPNNIYLMDNKSFEQFSISLDRISEKVKFLKDGLDLNVLYFNGNPINVDLPIKMQFKVVSAPPGVRGDTASGNVTKRVTLENGLEINTPLFIKEGDEIIINTGTGEYVERG
jgi:elongation factor P